jgi:hypothetical protein
LTDANFVTGHEIVLLVSIISNKRFLPVLGEDKVVLLKDVLVLFGVGAGER